MKKLVGSLLLIIISSAFSQSFLPPIANTPTGSGAVTNPQFGQQQFVDQNTIQQTQTQENLALQQLTLPKQVQQLQQTVQALRGLVENQGQQLEQLQLAVQALQQNNKSAPSSAVTNINSSANTSSAIVLSNIGASGNTNDSVASQALYQQAYQLIQNKQYTPAISLLQQYLVKQPNGNYAGEAHYWLGEIYAESGDRKSTRLQFTTVVNNFPNSKKTPDAMLKLGIITYSQGQYQQSKAWYNKVMATYPNSNAATIAASELQQLIKAGY